MIVDASVALKWLVVEDDSARALELLAGLEVAAPTLIHAEVGNAIWKKRRRGELGNDPELATLPEQLAAIITTIDETPMMARALAIAAALDHPIYDCVYLAVAEAMDQPLVTADRRFIARLEGSALAARVSGLPA